MHHLCNKNTNFVHNFKTRFTATDSSLFDENLLSIIFEQEIEMEKAKT